MSNKLHNACIGCQTLVALKDKGALVMKHEGKITLLCPSCIKDSKFVRVDLQRAATTEGFVGSQHYFLKPFGFSDD